MTAHYMKTKEHITNIHNDDNHNLNDMSTTMYVFTFSHLYYVFAFSHYTNNSFNFGFYVHVHDLWFHVHAVHVLFFCICLAFF